MRKTKRIFPMLLALVMILSLCACGGKPAAPEKCFSLSEQNTGSLPFSGLTAGVGIVWN